MRRILIPSCFLVLLIAPALAQNANVAGRPSPTPIPAWTTLRARVFYEDTGRPIRRTTVILMSGSPGRGKKEQSGVTDTQGNLEIKNLPAGRYFAVVNAPGVVSPFASMDLNLDEQPDLPELLAGHPTIDVNGISDLNTQIAARRGGAISGRITYSNGDPAIGVKVELLRKAEDQAKTTVGNLFMSGILTGSLGTFQTDDRGYYRFAALPAGEYIVRVTENIVHATKGQSDKPGDMFFLGALFGGGGSSMVTLYFPDVFDQKKAQGVGVELGQEVPEINLVIPDRQLHDVEGKVIAAHDRFPIRKATVTLTRKGDAAPNQLEQALNRARNVSYTDDEGKWKFQELPPGEYEITVEATSSEFDKKDKAYGPGGEDEEGIDGANRAMANAANHAANAMVAAGLSAKKARPKEFAKGRSSIVIDDKSVTDQTIEIRYGSTISGEITVDGGKELPHSMTVTITNREFGFTSKDSIYNYGNSSGGRPVVNLSEFSITGVPAGKAMLSLERSDEDFYLKKATSGSIDLLKDPIDLKAGDDITNIQIVLATDLGTLKGTVLDSEKQPLIGLRLVFVPTDAGRYKTASFDRTIRTDENGEFEIKLPPFEYALVWAPDRIHSGPREEFSKWLAENLKQFQMFKIEANQTSKATIKRDKPPPK